MPVNPSARPLAALLALIFAVVSPACAGIEDRFDRDELDRADAGLVLGEFPLKQNAIVDGDTIKVDGLDASLRLLGIDTEETFKSEKAWRRYEVGWEQYLANEQAKTSKPIKVPTPLGMDAKHWAQDFFAGVTRVRLERDHPKEIRGRFNRYLVYVFVERDGRWINYNVESVRAGMSPYFTKYGYSRRFHAEFEAAQDEARAAKRGIWADGALCYQDYDLRLEWWRNRADFVAEFEADAEADPSLIALTNWDAKDRLAAALGEEVEVLGTVGEVRQGERGPKRVLLSRRMFDDFPLIFWEDDVFEESGIDRYRGEYIRVRGVVTAYTNRRTGERQLQIEVRDPIQVTLPGYVPPGKADDPDLDMEFEREPEGTDAEALDGEAVEAPADFVVPEPKAPEAEAPEAETPEAETPEADTPPADSSPSDPPGESAETENPVPVQHPGDTAGSSD